jgi:5-methylcytosine-specific restriction protein B
MALGSETQKQVDEVVNAADAYGRFNIIALSGVAGTGKTFVALAAAQKLAGHPLFVKQIQFHQSYTYEDFIEGLRPNTVGGFEPRLGIFTEWNLAAHRDHDNKYVLLIEEFTRANLGSVLGELMTFIEHRDRMFETPLSRTRTRVADNLHILVTLNPKDRSAIELDDALIRRMRMVNFPPSVVALREILDMSYPNTNPDEKQEVINQLVALFEQCKSRYPESFEANMPFGHAVFSNIRSVADLRDLWNQQIRFVLRRPQVPAHPYAKDIEDLYPWR